MTPTTALDYQDTVDEREPKHLGPYKWSSRRKDVAARTAEPTCTGKRCAEHAERGAA